MRNRTLSLLRSTSLVVFAISVVTLVVQPEDAPTATDYPHARIGNVMLKPCPGFDSPGEENPLQSTGLGQFSSRSDSISNHTYCGKLKVGENEIQFALSTNKGIEELQASGLEGLIPVFWHPGGPGSSPATEIQRADSILDGERFAVFAWDGQTSSVDAGACGQDAMSFGVDRTQPLASLLVQAKAVSLECQPTELSDTHFFTGRTSMGEAAELESLRKALDIQKIHIWASSFGAAIAESYFALYPNHVASSVLVSPYFEGIDTQKRLRAMSSNMKRLETNWAEYCQLHCSKDLARYADSGFPALKAGILKARPRVGSGSLFLTETEFDQAILSASRYPDAITDLIPMFEEAINGDGTQIAQVSGTYFYGVDRSRYYTVMCQSFLLDPSNLPNIQRATRGNASQALFSEFLPCLYWDSPPTSKDNDSEGAKTVDLTFASRVLVLTNHLDVLSPVSLLKEQAWLAGAKKCSTSREGHGITSQQEDMELIEQFIESNGEIGARFEPLCDGS